MRIYNGKGDLINLRGNILKVQVDLLEKQQTKDYHVISVVIGDTCPILLLQCLDHIF